MFARSVSRVAILSGKRNIGNALQKGIWKKSNVNYIAYVAVGCIALEIVYGKVTDMVWDTVNRGVSATME